MALGRNAHRLIHDRLVFSRRAEKLTQALDSIIPASASILDVGCGNGLISSRLQQRSPGRTFMGVDVVERETCMIPCQMYDGVQLPFAYDSFDYVLFVDVLHHTTNIAGLLAQAASVARYGVIVKDHYNNSALDFYTLSLMDWFGNAQYGIALPCNYKSRMEWRELFEGAKLAEVRTLEDLGLYPSPFDLVFGRNLHFVSLHGIAGKM